jgi:pyridoxal 5'-phosphate synthase pdxT subunit
VIFMSMPGDAVRPAIGVLALQGDVAEHLKALDAAGARAVPVRRPAELDDVAGLVIPGGESTTMWKLAVIFDLMEPLRKRLGTGMPAFGSCAGMIMLADRVVDGIEGQETFGGIDMTVRRNAFGRQVDSVEIIGAESRTGRIVAVRQGPALATAFHPELTPDLRIHKLFVDMVRERS